MSVPKTLVFATGSAKGGGSGFEKLVLSTRSGVLDTEIVGVVSNYAQGGVQKLAEKYKIPFIPFLGPWTAEAYQKIAKESRADFFALSGWLKIVLGLDPNTRFNPQTVINNHPSLIPKFCGKGMYGHHVHEAVIPAYQRGEITRTGLTMHFVDEVYDHGPIFFQCTVKINEDDTPDSIGDRVNKQEHRFQSIITNLVVNGLISWDGVNPKSLVVPSGYEIIRHA